MPISVGSTSIKDIKVGSTQIQSVYRGTTLIWQNKVLTTYTHKPRLTQWNSINSPSWDWYYKNNGVQDCMQGFWSDAYGTWGNNRGLMVMNQTSNGSNVDWTSLLSGVEDNDIVSLDIYLYRKDPHGYYSPSPIYLYGTTQGRGWPTSGKVSPPPLTRTYYGDGNPLMQLPVSSSGSVSIPCGPGQVGRQIIKDLRDGVIYSLMIRSPLDGDGYSRPTEMKKHYVRINDATITIKVMKRP